MSLLTVGWALFGKEPGTHLDYQVLASTRWPMEAEAFRQAIRHFDPGDPPGARGGADDFPWAVFSTFSLKDGQFRGMAITSWSGHVDGTGRSIVETRYCCVRLDLTVPVGFRALYEAFSGCELATAAETPTGPATLSVPDVDGSTRSHTFAGADRELVAEAAAALLDNYTVVVPVTGSPPSLEDRLTFMDAVAAFLPGGAPWLTAGSWWDYQLPATRGRLQLTYSTRPGPGTYVLGRGQTSLSKNAQQYRTLLLRFCDQFDLPRVVEHLAAAPPTRRPDLDEALLVLNDLDLVATIRRHMQDGTSDVPLLKRLLKAGRVGELSPVDRKDLLRNWLPRLPPEQVAVFDPLWQEDSYRLLVQATVNRVKTGWSVAQLAGFRGVAASLTCEDQFLAEVGRMVVDEVPAKAARAEELISSVDPFETGPQVRELVRARPDLGAGLALRAALRPDRAKAWVKLSDDGTSDYHLLFDAVAYAVGRRPELSVGAFGALEGTRSCEEVAHWFHLVRVTKTIDPTWALREFVLPLLHRQADSMQKDEITLWYAELTSIGRTDDASLEASRDLLLCRWRQPLPDLAALLWPPSPSEVWRDYLDALEEQLCQLRDEQLDGVVGTWVDGLKPGWSDLDECGSPILDLLWKVTHRPPREPDAPVAEDILCPVSEEFQRNPRCLRDQRYSRWVEEIGKHKELWADVVEAKLARLPPDIDVPQVAGLCVELLSGPRAHAARRTVDALSRSRPTLDPRDCAWLCATVLQQVPSSVRPDALTFVSLLIQRHEDQYLGGPYRETIVRQALKHLRVARDLLEVVTSPPSLLGDQIAEQLLHDAQPVLQDLEAISRRLVDYFGQTGRKWSRLPRVRRANERRAEDQ